MDEGGINTVCLVAIGFLNVCSHAALSIDFEFVIEALYIRLLTGFMLSE